MSHGSWIWEPSRIGITCNGQMRICRKWRTGCGIGYPPLFCASPRLDGGRQGTRRLFRDDLTLAGAGAHLGVTASCRYLEFLKTPAIRGCGRSAKFASVRLSSARLAAAARALKKWNANQSALLVRWGPAQSSSHLALQWVNGQTCRRYAVALRGSTEVCHRRPFSKCAISRFVHAESWFTRCQTIGSLEDRFGSRAEIVRSGHIGNTFASNGLARRAHRNGGVLDPKRP